uniref:Alpha-macroglobulin receptor-binding domain-containing protein n=1 Tax=Arion vulgaris TaxID=1028688 RepID=A0A0B7AY52_9EUPU
MFQTYLDIIVPLLVVFSLVWSVFPLVCDSLVFDHFFHSYSIFTLVVTTILSMHFQIDTNFHIDKELTTPSFDVSTVLLDDELNSFNLLICSKWLWDRPTGMVVQKISIPSGFNPDVNSIGNVAGLMKSERSGSTVDVYFDKMSKTSVCYSIRMTRTHKVARIQENYVYTFDYYNPGDQSTIFWQSNKLGDSSVCDVCRELC